MPRPPCHDRSHWTFVPCWRCRRRALPPPAGRPPTCTSLQSTAPQVCVCVCLPNKFVPRWPVQGFRVCSSPAFLSCPCLRASHCSRPVPRTLHLPSLLFLLLLFLLQVLCRCGHGCASGARWACCWAMLSTLLSTGAAAGPAGLPVRQCLLLQPYVLPGCMVLTTPCRQIVASDAPQLLHA